MTISSLKGPSQSSGSLKRLLESSRDSTNNCNASQITQALGQSNTSTSVAKRQKLSSLLLEVLSKAPNMTSFSSLTMKGITADEESYIIRHILPLATKLTKLYLSICDEVDVEFAKTLGSYPQLEELQLRYCPNMTDEVVDVVTTQCSRLKVLNLAAHESKCTDKALLKLSKKTNGILNSLTELSLEWWELVTDKGIQALALNARNLKALNLSYCERITNLSVKALAKNLSLETLILSNCQQITDESFLDLDEHSFSMLKMIDLSDTAITDKTLEKFSEIDLAKSLISLHLDSTKITIDGLSLLEKFLHLKTLGIANNTLECRRHEINVLKNIANLEILNLSFVRKCSFQTIDASETADIIYHLTNLKTVWVTGLNIAKELKETCKKDGLQILTS